MSKQRLKCLECAPLRPNILLREKSNILIPLENKVLFFPLNVPENFSELSPLRTKLNKGWVSVRSGDCTWILVTLFLFSALLFMEWDTTVSVLQMCALKRHQASRKVYQPDTSVAEWETTLFLPPCHPQVHWWMYFCSPVLSDMLWEIRGECSVTSLNKYL